MFWNYRYWIYIYIYTYIVKYVCVHVWWEREDYSPDFLARVMFSSGTHVRPYFAFIQGNKNGYDKLVIPDVLFLPRCAELDSAKKKTKKQKYNHHVSICVKLLQEIFKKAYFSLFFNIEDILIHLKLYVLSIFMDKYLQVRVIIIIIIIIIIIRRRRRRM